MSHIRQALWSRYRRCTRCKAAPGGACLSLKTGQPMTAAHPYRETLSTGHHELEVRDVADETVAILVDGVEVGRFNHDEHGWAGIEAAVLIAKAIARATDMSIKGVTS